MANRRGRVSSNPQRVGHSPVLYVHGLGEQLSHEDLKREWDLALFGRDMGDQTRMAYWSDVLHGGKRKPDQGESVAGGGDKAERQLNLGKLLAEAGVDAKNKDARVLAQALLRAMGVDAGEAKNGDLTLPPPLRKGERRAFLEDLIEDTIAYFFRPDVRRKAQQRLRDLLTPGGESVTLVAHSLGGIIALEVLASLAKEASTHLVTMGSPLGIGEVQESLSCDLKVPRAVNVWHNFADLLDPLTPDKLLRDEFEPVGSDRTILDEVVANREIRSLEGFNPHSAVVYLAHPKVREVVHVASRIDPHARFLLARDVAAALAANGRQSVLIEVLEPKYEAVGESHEEMQAFEKEERRTKALEKEKRRKEGIEEGLPRSDLADRVERTAKHIESIVEAVSGKERVNEARVDRLRRFVAARLTPSELDKVAKGHRALRIYAVWKSNTKRTLVCRSARVIQADAARKSYGAFGDDIRWAVLDTGVRNDHPHFQANQTISAIWDCTNPGPPKPLSEDDDANGHGTHVSGIIAGGLKVPPAKEAQPIEDATPETVESMQGMAPRAKLMVYKVLDKKGYGEDAWIIKALDHIAEQNENSSEIVIHGLNLSLGGPYDSTVYGCGFTPLCAELRRLWRAGVLVVVAGGNEGQVSVSTPHGVVELNSPMSIGDPANLEDCIAVGSVNADRPHLYGVSSFSSHGPTSDGRMKPDVVAPGERIESCNSSFTKPTKRTDLYRKLSGTSMAAPHVSGLLAAFLSVRREFRGRPDEVKQLLLRTCVDIQRDRYHQGHGIPNLMRMLLEA